MPGAARRAASAVQFNAGPAAVEQDRGGLAARPGSVPACGRGAHRRCSSAGSGGPRRFWVLIRWKAEVLQLVASSPDTPEDVVIITGPLSALVSVGLALAGGLSIADSFGVNLEPVPPPPPTHPATPLLILVLCGACAHACCYTSRASTRRSLTQACTSHSRLRCAQPAVGEASSNKSCLLSRSLLRIPLPLSSCFGW